MKKYFIFAFMFLFMFTLVSADDIGTFKLNQEMQITNYCQSGVCTYVTLVSLEFPNGTIVYPNTNMTKTNQFYNYTFTPNDIGEYTFVTCGDSIIDVCDSDTFNVTFTGKQTYQGINIILLVFFSILLFSYHNLSKKINYDKWYTGIVNKYRNKNYVKMVFSSVWYNLIKNKFGLYYVLGFPIMILLTDIIFTYNVTSLSAIMEASMFIYSWGVLIFGVMLFGQFQEFMNTILDDVKKLNWGISGDE